jgi:hypothetical protein
MKALSLSVLGLALFVLTPGAANAQAPIAGQPYQVPVEYSGYGAGTTINYGGFNYVIQGDSTMLLADAPGFSYTSQYVPPTTYYVQQPAYQGWSGYGYGWNGGGYHHHYPHYQHYSHYQPSYYHGHGWRGR